MSAHKFTPDHKNQCDICGLPEFFHTAEESASDILQKDSPTNYREELYNAKVETIEEMRARFDNNEDFIKALTARHLELEKIIYEHKAEVVAIAQKLHDIGALARAEIREELRKNDAQYVPEFKKTAIKKKVSTKKATSPMERIVQSYALSKGLTLDEARAKIYSNPELMNLLGG